VRPPRTCGRGPVPRFRPDRAGYGPHVVVQVRSEWQEGTGRLTVPSLPASVSRIRRFAVAACREVAGGQVCDTVELLVSEVATNALVHGAGDVRVDVHTQGGAVRIEVSDDSTALPVPRDAGPEGENGRGMALVEALSSDWGTEARPDGKTVWFEVRA
jgi:serine/threonine-protein kinase RsbW